MNTKLNSLYPKRLHAEYAARIRDMLIERYRIVPGFLVHDRYARIYEVAYLFKSYDRYPTCQRERCEIHIDLIVTDVYLYVVANDHNGILWWPARTELTVAHAMSNYPYNKLEQKPPSQDRSSKIYPMALARPDVFDKLLAILDEMRTSPDNKILPEVYQVYLNKKSKPPALMDYCMDLFIGASTSGTVGDWIKVFEDQSS